MLQSVTHTDEFPPTDPQAPSGLPPYRPDAPQTERATALSLSSSPDGAVATKEVQESSEINRLLTAATINSRFRQQLLENPKAAIAQGYHNERFRLTTSEIEMLNSIQATTLAEFAAGLYGQAKHCP